MLWGSPNMPPKSEWQRQGLVFHSSDLLHAYGLKCPQNGTKNFLMCFQAYLLKHLLFDQKGTSKAASARCVLITHTSVTLGLSDLSDSFMGHWKVYDY